MPGNAEHWTQCSLREVLPVFYQRCNKRAPRLRIFAEFPVLIGQIVLQQDGRAIVERVREGRLSMHPNQSVLRKRQRGEKGRSYRHGMNCGAKVMEKSGLGQRQGAGATT